MSDWWASLRHGGLLLSPSKVAEFYAQLSNAYPGTNAGTDAATGDARHNGKDWVRSHEPEVYEILERVYAGSELEGTNPISAPLTGGGDTPTPADGGATP